MASGQRPSRSSVRLPSAYLVQEQHDFTETVQLKGLKYDTVLQSMNSGYYVVLSSILQSTVSPHAGLIGSSG